MAAPTGSEAQVGWGFERAENVRAGTPVNNFFRFKSMTGVVAKRGMVETENMDPSGQSLKGSPVSAAINPKFSLNPDVNSIPKLLVHHCSKDAVISTPAGGTLSRQWIVTPFEAGDAAPATWVDSLFFEASDGDGFPVVDTGCRLQDIDIKIADRALQNLDLTFMGCFDSYSSDATQVTVPAAYTGKPSLRGHWAAGTASPLKVRVISGAGGGFDAVVKFTTAAYAGATTISINFNVPFRIFLDDAARAGQGRFEELWGVFPSGLGTLTALDEWSFVAVRVPAVASYSTRDVLQAAGVEITIGGVAYEVHGADIKITRPRKPNTGPGSKYAKGIQKNGKWRATISLDRDREDREFLKKLIDASAFAVAVKMYGNPIELAIDELWQIDFPNCQVTDAPRDVASENALQEKIDIMAHRAGSTDILTHTVINTITAL